MAMKKTAPKKAAKPVVNTAKKSAASVKPVVKTAAVKKSAPLKKAAPAPAAPVKKAGQAAAKKAMPPTKTETKLKSSISSKPMTKKETAKHVKEEEVTPEVKNSGATQKSKPASKKQAEASEEVKKKASEPVKEVKSPKTTIKTSVPYQPEYKTLDQRQTGTNGKTNEPLVRYNDNELTEFRELINKKLEAAKKELAYLQGLITRKDELGGDETDNRYMTMEDGSMSMEREQLSQMASRQITFIDHLEKAMMRIENKTYGICRVTGKLIDKARLRAVPHATLSIEAKLGLVKPGTE